MTTYRITKYNPDKRNELGHYTDNSEWTSISDIGRPSYNNVTYEEYKKIESAYVDAIKSAMADRDIKVLTIDSLELRDDKKDFSKYEKTGRLRDIPVDFDKELKILKDGTILNLSQIDKIARLILRETIWMLLNADNFEVKFGYDYYMYIKCKALSPSTIKQIESKGLFVEPDKPQREFIITDQDGNTI